MNSTWQDVAYFENTTEGWMLEHGYSPEFIEWLLENNYDAYSGMELWIHTPTRQLFYLKELKQKFDGHNS